MRLGDGVKAAIHSRRGSACRAGGWPLFPALSSAPAGEFGLSPGCLLTHLKALTAAGLGWQSRRNGFRRSTLYWWPCAVARPVAAVRQGCAASARAKVWRPRGSHERKPQ